MMLNRKTIVFLVLALLLAGFTGGCGADDTPLGDTPAGGKAADNEEENPLADYPDDDLVRLGKQALSENIYAAAEEYFNELYRRNPDNSDALYGLVLADVQHWLELINMLLGLAFDEDVRPGRATPQKSILAKSLAHYKAGDDVTAGTPLVSLLEEAVIADLRALQEEQLARIEALKLQPDATFELADFPIYLKRTRLCSLRSEWDLADVYMIDAFTNGLHAFVLLLDSQHLAGTRLVEIYPDLLSGGDIPTMIGHILRVMDRYPDFLMLDEKNGATDIEDARTALTKMADGILRARELMEAESDNQANDVLIIGPTIDEVEHLLLQGEFVKDNGKTFSGFNLLWRGTKYGLAVSAEQLKANLAGEADKRLRLEHDIIALAAIAIDFFHQTISLGGVLDVFGVSLDAAILDLVAGIESDTGETFPKTIIGLLPTFLFSPKVLELDLGAYLARPVGVRQLLPNWRPTEENRPGDLYHSFECARLGFETATLGDALASGNLPMILDDPFSNEYDVDVVAYALRVDPQDEENLIVSDQVTAVLDRTAPELRFSGAVALAALSENASADMEDDTLSIRSGVDQVLVEYIEDSDAEAPLTVSAAYAADGGTAALFTEWLGCSPNASRDTPHFMNASGEYYTLADDGPAELVKSFAGYAVDGYPKASPYFAFRSGSMNNLLWFDLALLAGGGWEPEDWGFEQDMAKADGRSLNLFTELLMESLSF